MQGSGVRREEHEPVEVVPLVVDAVHHEGLVETCPIDIMSATTNRNLEEKSHDDTTSIIEMRINKKRRGRKLPPPPGPCPE